MRTIILIISLTFINGFSQERIEKPKVIESNKSVKKSNNTIPKNNNIKSNYYSDNILASNKIKLNGINYNLLFTDVFYYEDGNTNKNVTILENNGNYSIASGYTYAQERRSDWSTLSIFAEDYEYILGCHRNLIMVKKDNKWGGINLDGNEIVPFIYDDCWEFAGSSFTDRKFVVLRNGKIGWIDANNNYKNINEFEYHNYYEDGIMPILIKEKLKKGFGSLYMKKNYINSNGQLLFNTNFESVNEFSDGVAWVQNTSFQWSVINKSGNLLFSFGQFEPSYFSKFCNNTSTAIKNGKLGVINKNGDVLIPFIYNKGGSNLCFRDDDIILLTLDGKQGYVDINNNIVVPFIFDEIIEFNPKYGGKAKLKGVKYNIDSNGKIVN